MKGICGCPRCKPNELCMSADRALADFNILTMEFNKIVHTEWSAADEANARLAAERECQTTIDEIQQKYDYEEAIARIEYEDPPLFPRNHEDEGWFSA